MAAKRRFLDVWITEGNTVYKEVPFDVVADWVQQGRLLEDDMVRPSGTVEWTRLGGMSEFAVYLPKPPSPDAEVESQVEPMEEVETGFNWKRPYDDEDSEVDMIPLIDVSLVLLIFFMLTTNPETSAAGPQIPTPPAVYGSVVNAPDEVWVGINLTKNANGDPTEVYSLGVGAKAEARNLATRQELLDRLAALLANKEHVNLTIDANSEVPSGDVRDLTVALEQPPFRSKIDRKYTGVSDKQP